MTDASVSTFASHIEALRKSLLLCVIATVALCPVGFFLAPRVIDFLVRFSFPENAGVLHFFSPMEVFVSQLKLGLILALAIAYPWNVLQLWRFLLPALRNDERKSLGWMIFGASALFFGGRIFCGAVILPLMMRFSLSFETGRIHPMLGLAGFLSLAGWSMFAFGVMFQTPTIALILSKFGIVSAAGLRKKRAVVMTVILIIAAALTPPDVVSQLLLAIPSWLLFELGILLSAMNEKHEKRAALPDEADGRN